MAFSKPQRFVFYNCVENKPLTGSISFLFFVYIYNEIFEFLSEFI